MPKVEISGYDAMLESYIYMNWLRPENVPWEMHANAVISPYLLENCRKMEIGTGNGYTTFYYLGGKFKKEYDWYFNTNTTNFWDNKDIFDASNVEDIARYIETPAKDKLEIVTDLKDTLIDQAQQLGIAKKALVQDGNAEIKFDGVDLVFSNMLYWLEDPFKAIKEIADSLPEGGRLVTVCPNPRYLDYCRSYNKESLAWTLINRGRADTLKMVIEPEEFEKKVQLETDFSLEKTSLYLGKTTMNVWDIGLRPISPYLIRMANALKPEERFEIKQDWCEAAKPIVSEVVQEELRMGKEEGAYNFFLLEKK
jgi:SAM-dependent methyltransferase